MNTLHTGPCWRIAPSGTTSVYLVRYSADHMSATVHSRGQVSRWAKQPMQVAAADLFASHEEARAEYRRRRALVETAPGRKAFNLTSGLALLACLAFATPAAAQYGTGYSALVEGASVSPFPDPPGTWKGTTDYYGGHAETRWNGPEGRSMRCTSHYFGGRAETTCQ